MNAAMNPNKALWEKGERVQVAGKVTLELPKHAPNNYRDFDNYWSPLMGGQGPAPGYAMSLSEERREALRERIRSSLPIDKDGSIPLMARVWAVRGRAP
jgi:hypothetical protein